MGGMGADNQARDFSQASVRNLVRELYGLEASVSRMAAERDFNYLIQSPEEDKYVFKISCPEDSREILEAQHGAMDHLAGKAPSIGCPQPAKTLSEETISRVTFGPDREPRYTRMLTFQEGMFYADLDIHPPELEIRLGEFLGNLSRGLEGFSHPVLNRYFIWDLKNIRDIRPYLKEISDPSRRNLVLHFIQMHDTEVEPLRHHLPAQVIHNDANDHNILVDPDINTIAGIIDFGDMVHGSAVNELAAGLAYALLDKADPAETIIRGASGYHSRRPLLEEEIEVLFFLIAARLSISVTLSSHRLNHSPDNTYLQISAAPAWQALEQLGQTNPNRIIRRLRKACGFQEHNSRQGLTISEILNKREKQIGRTLSVSYRDPLKMTSGYMQYLFDHRGQAYLDTVNNVCHVGHCHPRVVDAARLQTARLNTNTRYLYDSFVELAEMLCSTLPDRLSVCYFVNSGSEANELAIRMARTYTRQKDFIVIDSAYHGNTNAVIEISPYKHDGPGGAGPEPFIHKVRMPDTFRGDFKKEDREAGEKYARDIEKTIQEIRASGKKPAGFIAESIISVGGQIFHPENYLKNAYRLVRKAGGVCIADEVQVGFGRVGSRVWAFELQGVVPDIVTMGKPMGNGHPIAALVTTPEIDAVFNNGMEYFNTFGGNPVSCAIAKTVLEVISTENLQQHALETGEYFLDQLKELMSRHPLIGDVRGQGLFIGIELVQDHSTLEPATDEAFRIADRMREKGILISIDGALHNVIKIKPPMCIQDHDIDRYIQELDSALKQP